MDKNIILVAIIVILVGVVAYLALVQKPESPFIVPALDETTAKGIVIGFLEAKQGRDFENAKPFLSSDFAETIDPIEFAGISNPHTGRFEIQNVELLSNEKTYKVDARVYQEYTGEGDVGYNNNSYYVKFFDNRYLIDNIECGKYVEQSKDETANWELFTDNEIGYSLKYPPELKAKQVSTNGLQENITRIILPVVSAAGLPPNTWGFKSDFLVFDITRQKISDITDEFPPSPPGYTKEVVLQDEESLKNGEFGYSPAFSLKVSQKVVKIDDKIYGKEFITLAMFEVCDVLPTRTLIFFKNGYKVSIVLQAWAVNKIQSELPQYFTTDKENCGNSLIWNWKTDSQLQFYSDLVNGTISSETEAGIWYNTFDQIISTISLFGGF